MAKELPYFKFYAGKWIAGDITLCSMEAQGVFVNLISHYWNKGCSMSLANAKQRFSKNEAALEQLIFQKIILIDEEDNVVVNFLDEQMNEFVNVAEKRAMAGAKGGKANAKQMLSKAKAKSSNIEERRGEESIEERQKHFLEEIKTFENQYQKSTLNAFYAYWSEPNQSKTKIKKEMQKTWDTKRRLITWANNEKNFNK